MADLTCGMGDQLIALFTKGVTLGAYVLVEERLGFPLLTPDQPIGPWVEAVSVGSQGRPASRELFGQPTALASSPSQSRNASRKQP